MGKTATDEQLLCDGMIGKGKLQSGIMKKNNIILIEIILTTRKRKCQRRKI
jgi:hypothetical protein